MQHRGFPNTPDFRGLSEEFCANINSIAYMIVSYNYCLIITHYLMKNIQLVLTVAMEG